MEITNNSKKLVAIATGAAVALAFMGAAMIAPNDETSPTLYAGRTCYDNGLVFDHFFPSQEEASSSEAYCKELQSKWAKQEKERREQLKQWCEYVMTHGQQLSFDDYQRCLKTNSL